MPEIGTGRRIRRGGSDLTPSTKPWVFVWKRRFYIITHLHKISRILVPLLLLYLITFLAENRKIENFATFRKQIKFWIFFKLFGGTKSDRMALKCDPKPLLGPWMHFDIRNITLKKMRIWQGRQIWPPPPAPNGRFSGPRRLELIPLYKNFNGLL